MSRPRLLSSTGSEPPPRPLSFLLLGATGRLGRLLDAAFALGSAEEVTVCKQARPGSLPKWAKKRRDWCIWAPSSGSLPVSAADGASLRTVDVVLGFTGGRRVDSETESRLALATVELARRLGARAVFLASSAAVYGTPRKLPLTESDPPGAPLSPYGAAKLQMERAVLERAGRGDGPPAVCCLRIGNVAGADSLLGAALSATRDQPLRLDRFADGRGPLRSYIGPLTLARVLASLGRAAMAGPGPSAALLPGIVNVAGPAPARMEELLTACETAGLSVPWTFRPAPPGAIPAVVLDTDRLAMFHAFGPDDGTPAEMVGQWLACRGLQAGEEDGGNRQ